MTPRGLYQALAWRVARHIPPTRQAVRDQRERARLAWRGLSRPPLSIAGVRIPLGLHLVPPLLATIERGEYEAPELAIADRALAPDDVVMELGAGMGVISAFCARRIGSDRVHAYEANPAMERPIRRLYAANRVAPRLHMCVLGRQPGVVPFWIAPGNFLGNSLVRQPKHRHSMAVPVRAFNEEVRSVGPTFLIVDIEGGEAELLSYAELGRVRKVSIEVHDTVLGPEGVDRVARALTDRGFRRRDELSTDTVWYLERTADR